MKPHRIVVAEPLTPELDAALRAEPAFQVVDRHGLAGLELAEALGDAEALVIRGATTVGAEALPAAGPFRAVARAGVGVDNVDVAACTARGIAVINAPSANAIPAAEHTLALMLGLARRLGPAATAMRDGRWERSRPGFELHGRTLGILGLGRIGGEVAQRAGAFGMRIVAFDPYVGPARFDRLGVRLARSAASVFEEADVATLHVPLTAGTRHLVDADLLDHAKPGAVLVNAARGGVVDEAALLTALDQGRLAGAALDVFETEPLPANSPLRRREDVLVTPHLGAATSEAHARVAASIVESLRRMLVDGDADGAVNGPVVGAAARGRLAPLVAAANRLGRRGAGHLPPNPERIRVRGRGVRPDDLPHLLPPLLYGLFGEGLGESTRVPTDAAVLADERGVLLESVIGRSGAGAGPRLDIRVNAVYGHLRLDQPLEDDAQR